MIFLSDNMVETRIGVCPICRKTAELILSGKLDEQAKKICENELAHLQYGKKDF